MKKPLFLFYLIIALLLLTSCKSEDHGNSETLVTDSHSAETIVSTEQEPQIDENVSETDHTVSVTKIEEPTPQIIELEETYTVKILRGDFPAYDGPGYECSQVTTVKEAGIYTITAEFNHPDGTLWGRLKSGVGWVDITLIEEERTTVAEVTVRNADVLFMPYEFYYYDAGTEYAYTLEFSTNTLLRNVSLFQFIWDDDSYKSAPEAYHIDYWDSSKPFVARIPLDGPGAAWGLKFTDDNGVAQTYIVQDGDTSGLVESNVSFRKFTEPYTAYEEPAEPQTEYPSDLAEWKIAYLDNIKILDDRIGGGEYRLVYVDSDDIPELFISGAGEAAGCIVCSYKNGQVVTVHLSRLGGGRYIPESGLVYNCNGNMGYYTTKIYRLTDSGFELLLHALQEDVYEQTPPEERPEEYVAIWKFYLYNGSEQIEVTEDEYNKAQYEIFDFDASEELYLYNNREMHNYSSISQHIINW